MRIEQWPLRDSIRRFCLWPEAEHQVVMDAAETTYRLRRSISGTLGIPRFIHIGRIRARKPWSFRPHQQKSCEWLLMRRGQMKYWIDDVELAAGPGDFYFVQAGQVHREQSVGPGIDFFFLKFDLLDTLGRTIHLMPAPGDPTRQRLPDHDGRFLALFEGIVSEVRHERPDSVEIVESMILQMTWELRRRLNLPPPAGTALRDRREVIVQQAESYLKRNIRRRVSLTELGTVCCLSPDHLWHLFKEARGVTPKQLMIDLRMTEAKRLLRETDMTVFQVADALGYDDASYFSRQFKQSVSMSPAAFKR